MLHCHMFTPSVKTTCTICVHLDLQERVVVKKRENLKTALPRPVPLSPDLGSTSQPPHSRETAPDKRNQAWRWVARTWIARNVFDCSLNTDNNYSMCTSKSGLILNALSLLL